MTKKKVTWRDAQAKLDEIRANMLCTAAGFANTVKVVHQDGSIMIYEHAFARSWSQFWLVFTEHNSYHWFFKDDIEMIREFEYVEIVPLTKKEEKEWEDDMTLYKTDEKAWYDKHTIRL